jgi:hypothetical protein
MPAPGEVAGVEMVPMEKFIYKYGGHIFKRLGLDDPQI